MVLDLGRDAHNKTQLYINLKRYGVDDICLTDINFHWKIYHLVKQFSNFFKIKLVL